MNSYQYGTEYQHNQAEKYRNRYKNHWFKRIELAKLLFHKYFTEHLNKTPLKDSVIVDVGCSIGTFAIEFAKMGFDTYGIDFDESAIKLAREISINENVSSKFLVGDVSEWGNMANICKKIDVAICFDIFEHLHDDQIGSLLTGIKKELSQEGAIIFHTFPTEYNYLFYGPKAIRLPLELLRRLPKTLFEKTTYIYASVMDIAYLLKKGKKYRDTMQYESHCNLLTKERMKHIFLRAGFKILHIETSNVYTEYIDKSINDLQAKFDHQPISHRNLYGIAAIK
jgi:2-polyprenyl-3-methyl-5-hydroxy-6-metoxy-1,4-benzoquinol methylase